MRQCILWMSYGMPQGSSVQWPIFTFSSALTMVDSAEEKSSKDPHGPGLAGYHGGVRMGSGVYIMGIYS